MTRRFALIGHPVAGSLSPRMMAAAYGGRYRYDLLDFECFEEAWQAFLDGYDGINVTAPFKQNAFARVDVLSEKARATGAVNLVVPCADGFMGHNTDVDGVLLALRPGLRGERLWPVSGEGVGPGLSVVFLRGGPFLAAGPCHLYPSGAGGSARGAAV